MPRAARLLPLLLALPAALVALPGAGRSAPVPRIAKRFTSSIGMKLVLIPKGTFLMGSPAGEKERCTNEDPRHKVEITRPFYLGVYTVTQAQYKKVMGTNPSAFCATGVKRAVVRGMDTGDFPVESVSWHDAVAFCKKPSALPAEKAARRVYRLPSEAEWEYACRAGTTTPFAFGKSLSSRQANFDGRFPRGGEEKGPGLGRTCKVGSYKPNAWGLYDMHGNVWQWCQDWYDIRYYKVSPRKDPGGPKAGRRRVARGSTWMVESAGSCRAASRAGLPPARVHPVIGFRVACDVPKKP
jgi:formylglycine-generating enzyme required for sulfatase activity